MSKKGTVIGPAPNPVWIDEYATAPSSHFMSEARRLAERLAWERNNAKMTLRQVQDATGINNGYLSQLETGKIENPSVFTVKRLADFYGVPIDELFTPQSEADEHG